MRQVLFTALAVLMTATTNLVFAQSNDVTLIQSADTQVLEIIYQSDEPQNIGFYMMGSDLYIMNRGFGRISNQSNGDGTCSTSFDLEKIFNCPSGKLFSMAYESLEQIAVYNDPFGTNHEKLFSVLASDLTK